MLWKVALSRAEAHENQEETKSEAEERRNVPAQRRGCEEGNLGAE